jgi:hypothetical protein
MRLDICRMHEAMDRFFIPVPVVRVRREERVAHGTRSDHRGLCPDTRSGSDRSG